MSEYRTLRNTSGVEQWVMLNGQRYAIAGHSEESYEAQIADKFLDVCGPVVTDVTVEKNVGDVYAPGLVNKTMWIANMTGNLELPPKVKKKRFNKDNMRYHEIEVDNLNREPRDFSAELKGGHEQWFDSAGLVQRSLPSKTLVVPKYKRIPLPVHEARWLLEMDASCEFRGAIIESRPPSDFEPDMTWRLTDMRAYARLIDSEMDLGKDEQMLAKEIDGDEKKSLEILRQAKQQLLRRLYFRIVDPAKKLPTRKEFAEFLTGKSEEQLAREELESLMANAEEKNEQAKKDLAKGKFVPVQKKQAL